MNKNIILLENIRSAYNVWNIIRTADSLWRDIWLSGYTPHPDEQPKVVKTSLGAENNVNLKRFDNTKEAIAFAKKNEYIVLAWELDERAKSLADISTLDCFMSLQWQVGGIKKILILWNEVDGVLQSTLDIVDDIVYIPMNWIKESMNVGQSAAIFMRELWK